MAITLNPGRQETISAVVPFTFADFTSGVATAAVNLPEGAIVTGGSLVVRTAFNSATSDTIAVSLDAEPLLAASDVKAAAVTLLFTKGSLAQLAAPNTVDLTWTGVSTAPTTGAGYLVVHYVEEGRAAFSQD